MPVTSSIWLTCWSVSRARNEFWHQDEIVWNLVPEPKPELQLASVIALVDFTADNGATRVFPGKSPVGGRTLPDQ